MVGDNCNRMSTGMFPWALGSSHLRPSLFTSPWNGSAKERRKLLLNHPWRKSPWNLDLHVQKELHGLILMAHFKADKTKAEARLPVDKCHWKTCAVNLSSVKHCPDVMEDCEFSSCQCLSLLPSPSEYTSYSPWRGMVMSPWGNLLSLILSCISFCSWLGHSSKVGFTLWNREKTYGPQTSFQVVIEFFKVQTYMQSSFALDPLLC